MVEWDKDYHERTGKWRPLSAWRNKDGKINVEHPDYLKRLKEQLRKVVKKCDICGEYNLADPIIHHLPDGYLNDQKRKEYYSKMKKKKTVIKDTTSKQKILGAE